MSGTELWSLRFGELANTLSHERELLPQGKSAGSWHLAALVVWTEWKLSEEKQDSGKRVSHHGSQTASQSWQPFPVGSVVTLTIVIFNDVSLNAPTLGDLYLLVKQCITFSFQKNFYCYSITVVCLFSPPLHPTPAEPTSLPHLHPPPWFCPCVLYSSSCNPLSSLSPPQTMHYFQIILHQYKSHSSNVPE